MKLFRATWYVEGNEGVREDNIDAQDEAEATKLFYESTAKDSEYGRIFFILEETI